MKRGIALLGIPLVLGMAIAQTQGPVTPNSKTSDASSEASAEHIYGPKDGAKPPKLSYSRDPEYPKKARNSRKEGMVVLWLVVGSNGLPREVKVARSLSLDLDEAAIDAVKKWKFAPATKDGKPVASQINVEVSFHLY
jgi:TonB family protein